MEEPSVKQRAPKRQDRSVVLQRAVRWLTSPLLAGPLVSAVFLVAVHYLPVPMLHRYLLGHPICMAIVAFFFVAIVALLRVWMGAKKDLWVVDSLQANALCPTGLIDNHVTVSGRVQTWLEHLQRLPSLALQSLLIKRLNALLQRQLKRGHARNLNEDMRELADQDADAAHDALGLVRTTIWAIPMFGFLGTVVGITQTLGDLDFSNADSAMEKLKSGLYVAFDTTALGIALSVFAIYLQMPINALQQKLLARIDGLMNDLLPPNLPDGQSASGKDPMAAFGEMTERLLDAIERSVRTQSEVWRKSIDSAQQYWQLAVGTAGDQVQSALTDAIENALDRHASEVDRLQREGAEAIDQRWRQWQSALSDNARVMMAQQKALVQQGELLTIATERAEELAVLRRALDQNLVAVGQTLETMGVTNELAGAMRTLGRAIEILAERQGALAPEVPSRVEGQVPLRTRAAA